jgi:hypothetical protein
MTAGCVDVVLVWRRQPRQKAEIKRDLRGCDCVESPREEGDRWVVQASMFLAQGWRANCDLQVLLHDVDPDNPLPEDAGTG